MDFFLRHDEVSSDGTKVLPNDQTVSRPKRQSRTGKWPLRWVTISVVTFCALFWTALFFFLF